MSDAFVTDSFSYPPATHQCKLKKCMLNRKKSLATPLKPIGEVDYLRLTESGAPLSAPVERKRLIGHLCSHDPPQLSGAKRGGDKMETESRDF